MPDVLISIHSLFLVFFFHSCCSYAEVLQTTLELSFLLFSCRSVADNTRASYTAILNGTFILVLNNVHKLFLYSIYRETNTHKFLNENLINPNINVIVDFSEDKPIYPTFPYFRPFAEKLKTRLLILLLKYFPNQIFTLF